MAIPEVDLRSDSKGQPPGHGTGKAPASVHKGELAPAEHWFVCRQCRRRIAHSGSQITIQGQHRHVFANPSGIIFEIACYSAVRGCSYSGNPSTDFSWFVGFAWQILLCAGCQTHLGWKFSGHSGGIFAGLITDRVVLESSSDRR